jgi:hypothetical protein
MFIVVTSVEAVKEGADLSDIKGRSAAPPSASATPSAPAAAKKQIDDFDNIPAGGKDVKAASGTPADEKKTEKVEQKPVTEQLQREDRVVCGPELEKPMNIKIELDVYRFRGE